LGNLDDSEEEILEREGTSKVSHCLLDGFLS
jgi:hypothetical protein